MRANGDADDSQGGNDDNKKQLHRVFRYAYMNPTDNNISYPMFVIGYEEIYNDDLDRVVAVRIWKFVSEPAAHPPPTGLVAGRCSPAAARRSSTPPTPTRSSGASSWTRTARPSVPVEWPTHSVAVARRTSWRSRSSTAY